MAGARVVGRRCCREWWCQCLEPVQADGAGEPVAAGDDKGVADEGVVADDALLDAEQASTASTAAKTSGASQMFVRHPVSEDTPHHTRLRVHEVLGDALGDGIVE